METQRHSKDEVMSIIKIQVQKVQNLRNHLSNIEQLVHEWQSDALLSKRTSGLKQYSRRSCLGCQTPGRQK